MPPPCRTVRRPPLAARLALGLGTTLLAAGCSAPPQVPSPPGDPLLFGVVTPGGAPGAPVAPPPAAPGQAKTPEDPKNTSWNTPGVPPIPTNLSATNNATLASQSSLPGTKTLAIPAHGAAPDAAPGKLATNTKSLPPAEVPPLGAPIPGAPNPVAPTTGNPPPIGTPTSALPMIGGPAAGTPAAGGYIPKVVPVPRDTGAAAAGPGVVAAGSWAAPGEKAAPTPESMVARLKERGIFSYKQTPAPGGVRLTCYATRPDNPSEYRVLEVTAPTFVAAAEAVIRQVEQKN